MKSFTLYGLLAFGILFAANVNADCGDAASKDSDTGEVTSWFKNLGCTIKKGAEDFGETAKPWADKIGSTAKDFGNTVAQKYGEIKHKLTDDEIASGASSTNPNAAAQHNVPTEKVPLAPLAGDASFNSAPQTHVHGTPVGARTGEPELKTPTTPVEIDNRFLFQTNECPQGQAMNHQKICRPQV